MRAWFLNLGPPSKVSAEEAAADLEAILGTRPALAVGCEAVAKGKLPPAPPGYVKIRDTAPPGRANMYAYVRDAKNLPWGWDDCRVTFPRVQHPHMGPHPPRSILRFPYRGAQIIVAHKPPAWEGAGPARTEHDRRLAARMDPTENRDRPRLLLWDCNGLEGAERLAEQVRGRVVGTEIDSAIVRRVHVIEHGYREGIGGHRFHTDHKHGAFFLRWKPA